jgi:hypothetical protein
MKVEFHIKADILDDNLDIIIDFIKYVNKFLKLTKNIRIDLVDKKTNDMTTGVRESKHHIKVLCKDRMLVDILRTIAHELVHEFQHQKLGVKEADRVKEVGGKIENQANALSGSILKKFVLTHKDLEKLLY